MTPQALQVSGAFALPFAVHLFSYTGILLLLALTIFGFPIPQELPLFIGGVLIHQGACKAQILIPACVLVLYVGDLFFYFIGRQYGHYILRNPKLSRLLTPARLEKIQLNLEENLHMYLFSSKFTAGLRLPTYVAAGALRVPIRSFLFYNALSNLVLAPVIMALGWLFGSHIHSISQDFSRINRWLAAFGTLIILGWSVYAFYKYRRYRSARRTADPT